MAKVKRPIKYITPGYTHGDTYSAWLLPIRIVSEANRREHFHAVARRKKQQQAVWMAYTAGMRFHVGTSWLVTLTRLGPRVLDDDNLAGGFKAVRDQIAKSLGVDDGDTSKVRWKYEQQKSKAYGAIVRIEPASPQK